MCDPPLWLLHAVFGLLPIDELCSHAIRVSKAWNSAARCAVQRGFAERIRCLDLIIEVRDTSFDVDHIFVAASIYVEGSITLSLVDDIQRQIRSHSASATVVASDTPGYLSGDIHIRAVYFTRFHGFNSNYTSPSEFHPQTKCTNQPCCSASVVSLCVSTHEDLYVSIHCPSLLLLSYTAHLLLNKMILN